MDLGSHVFDLLEFLLGRIVEIEVEMEMADLFADIEHSARIRLNFEDHHTARIDLRWLESEISQKYFFSFSGNSLYLQRQMDGTDSLVFETKTGTRKMNIDSASEYIGLFDAWCESMLSENEFFPGLEDGLKNQSIIDVIYSAGNQKINRLSYSQERFYEISH